MSFILNYFISSYLLHFKVKSLYRCLSVKWDILYTNACCPLTHLPSTKWPPFCRRYVQVHIRERKSCILIQFDWSLFPRVQPSTGSDNVLAPKRRQAIIWTNAHLIHWRIYAVLGGDQLKSYELQKKISQMMHICDTWSFDTIQYNPNCMISRCKFAPALKLNFRQSGQIKQDEWILLLQ